ncbi:hypothetical protein [Rhizobium sp. CC-YZS058]|uniref:hypothetical protein n=1 Tax=Rhizobium sp. CC-YZS058 TaxID=3042153 RepID=UPI002B060B71|nr:hypothetical protein [Rhizobium sp. CC-YZS058]MEA3536035.1 hypothetical protein [Rhizobium sp. CC-YZS058]
MDVQAAADLRIRAVLGRLETILDNENARIGVDPSFDLKASNQRKSRCLYELAMFNRDQAKIELTDTFRSQTGHLREKLSTNAEKIEAHLEACRSVVELIKTTAQDVEADGIYTEEQFRYGAV